jgi:hypothetical protein
MDPSDKFLKSMDPFSEYIFNCIKRNAKYYQGKPIIDSLSEYSKQFCDRIILS